MTDSKDSSAKGGNRPGEPQAPKRPHATLDLKAVEVKAAADQKADVKAPAAAASAGASSASAQATAAAASTKTGPDIASAKPAEAKSESKPADTPKSTTASTAARPAAPAKPVPPPQRSGGFGRLVSHLVAGLAGGTIVLFGGDKLASMLGLPAPGSEQSAMTGELQKRLALVEQSAKSDGGQSELAAKLAEAEARLAKIEQATPAIGALQEQQSKLAAEAKALSDKIAETAGGPAAADRLAKLEERLATLAAAAETDGDKGRIQGLAAITGKVSDLETNLANQVAALRKLIPQEVEGRLGAVAESSEAAKTGTQRLDKDLASLKTETARTTQRLDTMKSEAERSAAALRVLQEEHAALSSAVNDLKGSVDAQLKSVARPADVASALAPVAGKVTQLEQSLQNVVKGEEDRKVNAERIVVSLELANLKRALDQGQAYASELDEVKKASAGRLELAALDRYKETGVPTLADLQKEFRPVMHAILDAETEPAEGSVVDRLLAGAKSVVRVRKVNHTTDDKTAEAIVSRIEAALEDGQLAAVISETGALSDKARGPANDWLAKVEARHSVDRAIATVESQLKASLAGAAPAAKTEPAKPSPIPAGADKN